MKRLVESINVDKNYELDGVLSGEGSFTVFAPTDDAFGKLPEGTVAGFLEDIPTWVL